MLSGLETVPIGGRACELTMRMQRRIQIERARASASPSKSDPLLLRCALRLQPVLEAGLRVVNLYSSGLKNATDLRARRAQLCLPGLPAEFAGFRLLHLSDLHIDGIDGLDQTVAEAAANLPVDLCVLTGDYRFATEGDCSEVYRRMRRILASIDSVHGAIGILGNHDSAAMAPRLEELGVRMLINESVEIRRGDESIWIAGVDDPYHFQCDDLALAVENVPADGFRVLLAHTAQLAEQAARSGIDLYLCGHTHAGQLRLPWIGPLIDNGGVGRRFNHGLWRLGSMQGYTSAGVGCSMLPVRFNCPPEITVFDLQQFQ